MGGAFVGPSAKGACLQAQPFGGRRGPAVAGVQQTITIITLNAISFRPIVGLPNLLQPLVLTAFPFITIVSKK